MISEQGLRERRGGLWAGSGRLASQRELHKRQLQIRQFFLGLGVGAWPGKSWGEGVHLKELGPAGFEGVI